MTRSPPSERVPFMPAGRNDREPVIIHPYDQGA